MEQETAENPIGKHTAQERVTEAIIDFLNSEQAWEEKKRILESQSDILLTDPADQIFADLLLQYEDDKEVIIVLHMHRALLTHCRHFGIDEAFQYLLTSTDPADLVIQYASTASSWKPAIQAVINFLNEGQTWAEKKRIVETQRDLLLTDTADQVLVDLLLQYKDDWITSAALQIYRSLLADCRQLGIDEAFARFLTPDITQVLVDLVIEFAEANLEEAKQLVENRKEDLLSESAFQVLQYLLQKYQNDSELLRNLEDRFALLKRCLLEGIDVAFADQGLLASEDILRAVSSYIDDYYNGQTFEETKLLIEQQQEELFTEAADQVFAYLIRVVREQGDLVKARDFIECRALLKRCRDDGINSVFADLFTPSASHKTMQAVMTFINAETDEEQKHIVEIQPDLLLTDAADEYLATLLPLYKDDEELIFQLQGYRTLLENCRRHGIESAFNERKQLAVLLQEELPRLTQPHEMPRKIEAYSAALRLVNPEIAPVLWGSLQTELGDSLLNNNIGDTINNIEEAIQHYQLALEAYDPMGNWKKAQPGTITTNVQYHHRWATALLHLGIAYVKRVKGNRSDNLERAIEYYHTAQKVFTRGTFPEDWTTAQINLGEAYSNRIHGSRAQNLEQAIKCQELALEVVTRETLPDAWVQAQFGLGNAFLYRILGDPIDNLERTIRHYYHALNICSRETKPDLWANIQHNMGIAFCLQARAKQGDSIEQAILHFQQALEIFTYKEFPMDWALAHNHLGNAYRERNRGDRVQNLDNAIKHYNLALEVYSREIYPEQWAMVQLNLGGVYYEREDGNVQLGIYHSECAIEVYTPDDFPEQWALAQYNLGRFYATRVRDDRSNNFDKAVNYLRSALEVRTPDIFPYSCLETLRLLGDLYFWKQQWEEASATYERAMVVENALLEASYIEISRQFHVSETANIYMNASYCQLKLGKLEEALILLERGKTRLLTEALALGDTNLTKLSAVQRKVVFDQVMLLRELEAEMRLLSDAPGRRSNAELGPLLRRVRIHLHHLLSGSSNKQPDFMATDLAVSDILALVPEGGAIIAPVITSQSSAVFVLPFGLKSVTEEHVIFLERLNSKTFSKFLIGTEHEDGWLKAYIEQVEDDSFQKWMRGMENFTHELWGELLEPIQNKLLSLGVSIGAHVVMMPEGGLGLLPLHTAWRWVNGKKRTFLDDYIVSYAPSAYVLKTSYQRLQDRRRHQHSLLAVVNPTSDLPHTIVESTAIAKLFTPTKPQVLTGSEATREAITDMVLNHTYLHFACHGFYNWRDPKQSGLVLADGNVLLLSEILSPSFNLEIGRLVTLSACETGLTEYQQSPDEYIGLPAGFLQAGATAVVSTLWAVPDLSTALLMERFYSNHLAKEMELAAALREAQIWVRELTVGDVVQQVEQWYRQSQQKEKAKLFRYMRYYRSLAASSPAWCPFAHPYYWAAFTLNGW